MTLPLTIASLPMYDFPDLEPLHDQLWSALREQLLDSGLPDVPERLSRGMHHESTWVHPELLLSQACEYPLAKRYPERVRVVAYPRYNVAGCLGSSYRSAILVRADEVAEELSQLRGTRCAVNDLYSNSGMNLLRAAIAPIAGGSRFFSEVLVSGSHLESLRALARGGADVCAVDCVTLAHLSRLEPMLVRDLRTLGWTPASPSLPFVTAASASDSTLEHLRQALTRVESDRQLAGLRQQLHIDSFNVQPAEEFNEVLRLEKSATHWGYPELH